MDELEKLFGELGIEINRKYKDGTLEIEIHNLFLQVYPTDPGRYCLRYINTEVKGSGNYIGRIDIDRVKSEILKAIICS